MPITSARIIAPTNASVSHTACIAMLASGGSQVRNTHAISKLVRFAVAIMHRFRPPLRMGINIASVSKPSSGSWKATLIKVASLKNRPGMARLNPMMTTSSNSDNPSVVLSIFRLAILSRGRVSGLVFRFKFLLFANIAGSLREADFGFFAFLVMGNSDGRDNHHADNDIHEVAGHADQVKAVFQHTNQEHAHQCADHDAFAAIGLAPPSTAAARTSSSPPTSAFGTNSPTRYTCTSPPMAAIAPR